MEEKIITTGQVAETAEDIIVAADSDNGLKTASKVGLIAIAVVGVGVGIDKAIKYFKSKKQQTEETSESNQGTEVVNSTESDEE